MTKEQLKDNAEKIAEQLDKGKNVRLWKNKDGLLRASIEQNKPIELVNNTK